MYQWPFWSEGGQVAPGAPVDLAAVADENDFGRVVISWNAPLRDADNAQLTGLQVYTVYI